MRRFVLIPVVAFGLLGVAGTRDSQIDVDYLVAVEADQEGCTLRAQPYIYETILEGTISESTAAEVVDVCGHSRYSLLGRFEGPPNATFKIEINNDNKLVQQESLTLNASGWLNFAKEYTVYGPRIGVVVYHPPAGLSVDLTLYAASAGLADTPAYQSATWVIAQDASGQIIARYADGNTTLTFCQQYLDRQDLAGLITCAINEPNVPKTVFIRRGNYEFLHYPDSQYCGGDVPTSWADTEGCHLVHMRDNVTVVLERGVTLIVPHGYRGSVFSFQEGVGSAAVIGGRITEKTEPSLNAAAEPLGARCGGPTFQDTQDQGQWTYDGNGCVLRRWRAIQLESLDGGQPNYNSVRDVIIGNADVGIDLLVRSEADPEQCPSDEHACYKLDEDTGECEVAPKGNIAGNEFKNVQIFGPRSAFIRFRHEGPRECMHGANRNYFEHVRGDAALDTPLGAKILGKGNVFVDVKFWEVEYRGPINPNPVVSSIGNCKQGESGELVRDDAWDTLIIGGLMTSSQKSFFEDCGVDTQIIDHYYHQVPTRLQP